MVPGAGIEPARCCHRGILSPLRLPISPPGLREASTFSWVMPSLKMEARAGVEPAYVDLQSSA